MSRQTAGQRVEVRDGREYVVTVLPEAKPPKRRSATSRYRIGSNGKPTVSPENVGETPKYRKRKHGSVRSRRRRRIRRAQAREQSA